MCKSRWRALTWAAIAAAALSCGRASEQVAAPEGDPPAPEPTSAPDDAAAVVADAGAVARAPDAMVARAGHDFIAEARLLYRVTACAGDAELPAAIDVAAVTAHCRWLESRKDKYRVRYVDGAGKFLASILPGDLPPTVVYPFGGGDLISALVAFPTAREITTISLELSGDPRSITNLSRRQLRDSLHGLRSKLGGMLSVSNNISTNLSSSQENLLPTQLAMFLIGLAVNDFEPVSLRFFRLEADGSLHYFTAVEIAEIGGRTAAPLKGDWKKPSFAALFANSELGYRRRDDPDGVVRVHRHIGANLADAQLSDNKLLRHLERKGRVTAMTKAASYLLWRAEFARIRDYLLANMELLLSDSTGIPPRYVNQTDFEFVTYGSFYSSLLRASARHNRDFRQLWKGQPRRRIGFRFGYVDAKSRAHLLITRRR